MPLSVPIEIRTIPRPVGGAISPAESELPIGRAPCNVRRPQLAAADLAFRVYAAFRAHPHVNNVLTHISRARWIEVEQSIHSILDPGTTSDDLSPLGRNIVALMVAERGITGKILKPYFHATLHRLLEPSGAERLIRHVGVLFRDLEWKLEHPMPPQEPSESDQESQPCQS